MIAHKLHRARGIALPVMMIMLLVTLIGSIYLVKASNSSTITAANLGYDSTLSKAADLGLQEGFRWLSASAGTNRLQANNLASGYVATLDTTQSTADAAFWNGKVTLNPSADLTVEYVIHRACSLPGAFNNAGQSCVQTSDNPLATGTAVATGREMGVGSPSLNKPPQIHYVITSRIYGPRGGNVVNQLVVLIDP